MATGLDETKSLEVYAAAAAEIGKREWARAGIAWCAQQSADFFRGGGAGRLVQNERRAAARREAGEEAGHEAASAAAVEAAADTDMMLGVRDGRPIRLLDVGACGDLLQARRIAPTPLDLCAAGGVAHAAVRFLSLEVGAPNPNQP